MKHLALALTILGAAPAIAFAQGDDTGMGGAPAQTTTPTTASPGSEPGAMSPTGSPPEIFHHGTMGLSASESRASRHGVNVERSST